MTSIKEYMDANGMTSPKMRGHTQRRITPEKVARIKDAINAGNSSVTALRKEFRVSAPTIYNVMNGKYDAGGCAGGCKHD